MPCTMGDSRPTSGAAVRSGVDQVVVTGDHREGTRPAGAVTVTSRRRRRRVSVALTDTAPQPNRVGQIILAGAAADGKRSSGTASTVPAVSLTLTVTGTTQPTSVS